MLTYTSAIELYEKFTNSSESANTTLGATLLNEGVRFMLGDISWPFLEKNTTIDTVDGQQFYEIPADASKVLSVTVKVGDYLYRPLQVFSRDDWDALNSTVNIEGDQSSYFYIFNGQIGLWTIPATDGNTITVNYLRQVRDISVADYTTGNITDVTNGSTTVEGSGTSWTSQMAGKYIRITHTNTAGTGDGIWYKIASVTDGDTLELEDPYLGTSISGGSASYTIGDVMVIPENYQLGPVYYAASEYWRLNGDANRADRFQSKYELLMRQMREDEGKKTTSPVVDEGVDFGTFNPNLAPRNITES